MGAVLGRIGLGGGGGDHEQSKTGKKKTKYNPTSQRGGAEAEGNTHSEKTKQMVKMTVNCHSGGLKCRLILLSHMCKLKWVNTIISDTLGVVRS